MKNQRQSLQQKPEEGMSEQKKRRCGVISRRRMLSAGSTVLLGAVINPSLTYAGSQSKLPFDIRTLVPDAQADDSCIQVVYDAINCMVVLIGDIPFEEFFGTPMIDFIPRIYSRIRKATEFGLITDPISVETLMTMLQVEASHLTMADFFASSRREVPTHVLETLIKLRTTGIQFPIPIPDEFDTKQWRNAINQLVSAAHNLTFKDLFLQTEKDVSSDVIVALRQAQAIGLFAFMRNDRCCYQTGPPLNKKICIPGQGWCAHGLFSDECSVFSKDC